MAIQLLTLGLWILAQGSPSPSPSPSASPSPEQVEIVLSPDLGNFIVEFMKCTLFHWVCLIIGKWF